MARETARKSKGPAGGGRGRKWRRRLVWFIGLCLAVPILQVACMRWVDPPATPLMGIRWAQDRMAGERHPRVQYHWLPWRQLPTGFLKAAWALEDARFFRHHGFDWIEMRHAMERARQTGDDPRGSSTITMQCARSLFLWQGHSYIRKGLEAYYTVWMELLLSKRRILELYANVIEMGPGVYGIDAASRHHYGVPPSQLNAEQSAYLAALLPAPRKWDPRHPSRRLLARQRRALREVAASKWPGA